MEHVSNKNYKKNLHIVALSLDNYVVTKHVVMIMVMEGKKTTLSCWFAMCPKLWSCMYYIPVHLPDIHINLISLF